MQLSPHFSLVEFTRSQTATKLKIDNTPNEKVVNNLKALCTNVLEPLRLWYDKPISIGSGYRCPKLNKAVGGVTNSQHMSGEACDLHLPTIEIGKKWFEYIKTHCIFDQLIWERSGTNHYWIHVSFRANRNRKQVIPLLIKK